MGVHLIANVLPIGEDDMQKLIGGLGLFLKLLCIILCIQVEQLMDWRRYLMFKILKRLTVSDLSY